MNMPPPPIIDLPAPLIPGKLQASGKGIGCALIQVNVSLKSVATLRI